MGNLRKLVAWVLVFAMVLSAVPKLSASAEEAGSAVLSALDFGADPTGAADSTVAIQKALAAAKELEEQGKAVTLVFPQGEYHIYKDKAETREYHTSNTNSIENPIKTIGLLIEEHKNLTIDGQGSLFMMHGNMMALAVAKSENIVLRDFSWDFAVPTVTELTVTASGSNYTEFYIPECFPYRISGNTLVWSSDLSPYTGEPYWTATGNHNTYAVVTYHPDDEMARNFGTDVSPFTNASSITEVGDNVIRVNYSRKNGTQAEHHKPGTVFALCGNAHRETAGAFTWESKNVLHEGINVHFMHGFGWLIQMSEDVTYRRCNLMPRPNSGHITVSFADGLHASGAKGEIIVEDCNFSNTHDDPINFHGTFTRVERRIDDHTLELRYIHQQQGGFPQYHVGDQVAFFTRNTLESSDNETLYTVAEVISNPGENGNNLRTMKVRFEEELPTFLTQTVSDGTPKYVAENVTYAPAVTIRNNTFKNTATRGILCTTREPVLIEGNTFLNMSMATIFLSNDSGDWYESGPIRNMTIKDNVFYIKTIGDTWWDYKSAIYIHPVTYGNGLPTWENPIHKNITIEGNTFHMSDDTVVKAESVENLIFRDNTIVRTDPDFTIELSGTGSLLEGETAVLKVLADGTTIIGDNNKNLSDTTSRQYDNVFEFTACKNVLVEGNTYDDGMKNYAVIRNMPESELTMKDEEITVVSNASMPADEPVSELVYVSTEPDVLSVDGNGKMTAISAGSADVYAYYVWNGTIVKSNVLTVTVAAGEIVSDVDVQIEYEGTLILDSENPSVKLTANVEAAWSAADFVTGGSTDVITVSADGTVTAKNNGIAWVRASAGGTEDQIPVVVNLSVSGALADGFRFVREDKANYRMDGDSITITQQGGNDLWQWDNNLENLLLFGNFDRSDLRTVVKIDGLPARKASGNWDTASFLLYKGDDDYITIGKKGHFDGFATVIEQAQSCTESGGNSSENAVTSAYVGFTVEGTTATMSFKVEGGEWTTAKTIDIGFLGNAYSIGFGAWGAGGNDVTYSEFKVGKASEVSYDELMEAASVTLYRTTNTAPAAENVTFDAASYQVGETASVTYTYLDAEGDAQGQPYYLWSWEGGCAVTRTNTFTITSQGSLTCAVFPVDALGAHGAPAEATVTTTAGEADLALNSLRINGVELLGEEALRIPADLAKLEVRCESLMPGVGTTTVNGAALPAGGAITLDVTDTVTVVRSAAGMEDVVYTVKLIRVESNDTEIFGLGMTDLDLHITDLSQATWLVRTTESASDLYITADDRIGHVEVAYGNYRESITLTETATGYEAQVDFINGLNSYYITVYAKDGITLDQYNINVVYTPDTTAELLDLKINGKSIDGFSPDTNSYLLTLEETDTLKVEAVSDQQVRIRIDGEYVMDGKELEVTGITGGSHEICVVVVAEDGIVKNVYRVDAVIPYEQNVELFTFELDGKDLLDRFDANGNATAFVGGNNAELNIVTKDSGATIQVGDDVAVGSYSGTVALVNGAAVVEITITARDGVTTASYTLNLKKVMDPNDSSRDIPVEVLTATAGDWQTGYEATEGPANLVLDGNPGTIWHTDWYGTSRANHWIQFEIDGDYMVDGLRYQPRQSGSTNGTITEYDIQVSDDGVNFRSVTSGNWANNTSWKGADFDAVQVKFVRLVAVNAITDNSYVFASAAEIRLTGEKATAHEHAFGEWTVTTAPTCTETGVETRSCECGETETREIPALGHEYVNGECQKCDDALTSKFEDVEAGDFFFDPVAWAVEKGVTTGATDTTFNPNGKCQRAAVVTFLWRAAGSPEPTITENPFTDVEEKDFFYKAVLWAVEKNITTGTSATEFSPMKECNRAQVVTFLYRAMGEPEVTSTNNPFADVKADAWYGPAVLWAVENGITNGMSANEFGVNTTCNRAQVVTFLYRTYVK
ncbi:MAG: S-layer homology domain-containing protein [Oscillospiraceae bacterium]|nr:S-layer homology domain-containing protein [Oscillospiraceae bacterium]